ncbi:hypothetical protein [Dokdonella koreensis]|uniref:Transmembrane protein n=1 Tax=Dokdonella koreensis DS-123 TaxID=1300342 RepID=A0A160DT13_9GAMM|nr:hypothetical protein [Dokdonella koreensis]ANB17465.1 Hypothetical protein I596_1437 [Dokdonella koreensis DS-123]
MPALPIAVRVAAAVLGAFLLAATLRWHLSLMLWDHLDLVPIYQAWQAGALATSDFWRFHGGHLHTAAYAVLLATTWLSGGRPWLDCLVSVLLLFAYAGVIALIARDSVAKARGADVSWLLLVLFTLYPGHLANLQWGWQVAVFLCLAGVAVVVRCITVPAPSWAGQALALLAAAVAYLSFATAIALIPMAVVLLALRDDLPLRRRVSFALPWLAAGAAVSVQYLAASPGGAAGTVSVSAALLYVLNFLGGGIARFATDLAPGLAAAGLVSAGWAAVQAKDRRASLPWLGLCLFALVAAVLAAAGRVGTYGSDQAFSSRYVSFSSLFWLGWAGLLATALPGRPLARRTLGAAVIAVGLFAIVNAVHLARKAAYLADDSRRIAQRLRTAAPAADEALLREVYFDRADIAAERLAALRQLGFAPFDRAAGSREPLP